MLSGFDGGSCKFKKRSYKVKKGYRMSERDGSAGEIERLWEKEAQGG